MKRTEEKLLTLTDERATSQKVEPRQLLCHEEFWHTWERPTICTLLL